MTHDPLSPSEALRTPAGATVAAVAALVVVYFLVIVSQFLFGVIVGLGLTVGLYLTYRTFAALDSIADAAQRIAAARERAVEEPSRSDRPVDRAASRTRERSADRATERER
ncbi:hypothetical protein [Halorubrum pallidum]